MLKNGRNGYHAVDSATNYEDIQGILAATLNGNEANIDGVEFSSNGKYLVSSAAGELNFIKHSYLN